jgi:hypothetical protein
MQVGRAQRAKSSRAIDVGTLLCSEEGSTTIEFAMAIPVVVLLIAGSMIAMLGLLVCCNLAYATGCAARYAALHGEMSSAPASAGMVAAQVRSRLWVGEEETRVITIWSAGNVPGSLVRVRAVLKLPLAMPLTDGHEVTFAASSVRVVTR